MKGNFKNEARVSFEPGKVKAEYNILVKADQKNSRYTCYIPAFDLIYPAKSNEDIKKRADAMVSSLMNFYFKEDNPKNLFIALHKLGFRSPNHNMIMKDALNKKEIRAKFQNISNYIPEGYDVANFETKETELSVA